MKIKYEDAVIILFTWIILHPDINVYYSIEYGIEKYEVYYMKQLKLFEFSYDTKNKKRDMWREKILFAIYDEWEIPTNIKPDFAKIHDLLKERVNEDLLEAVKENIDSIRPIWIPRKIR